MKNRLLICLIFVILLCCDCKQSGIPAGSNAGTDTPANSETTVCTHPEEAVGGLPKYVYGQYCDDPVQIYLTCQVCGEEVFRGTMKNDIQCSVGYGNETVVKEPTCTEVGKAEGNCMKCGKLKQWDLPMIEHEYLWFYGDDTPSCKGCGQTLAVCAHEYEQVNDVPYTDKQAGQRSYKCKLCGDKYSVYYDKHGEYDVQAVIDAVCMEAQKYGWTVILDYNLTYGDELEKQFRSFQYREADSKSATKLLTGAGIEILDGFNQQFFDPNNDRSNYYLTVSVDISRSVSLGTTYLNIYLYVRSAD